MSVRWSQLLKHYLIMVQVVFNGMLLRINLYLYVEMYEVPTSSHYHALKKLRKSSEHTIFSGIIPFIEGGAEKIHCWAFQRKK